MDKILRPCRLDVDPHAPNAEEEWIHWRRTFSNFVDSIADTTDANKLVTLINFVSPVVYTIIAHCAT